MNPKHSIHHKYRADIDGLRAIAVLAVVGFHAFPGRFKGGFIGVDIFFIISGFLISSILFSNLENDRFSFVEFYANRIKRIFPALIVVLSACFAFGWFVMFPDEYQQLGKHITAGSAFVSNFGFWQESGYFDTTSELKPLLHLWSLGIEEQFYIVWPLLLWLLWKKRFNLLILAVLITLVSFVYSVRTVLQDPVAAFYSPLSRCWELMIGSILAYQNLHQPLWIEGIAQRATSFLGGNGLMRASKGSNTLKDVMAFCGMALIVWGFLFITKEKPFPGSWALFPALGTYLIVAAGPQAYFNRTILSRRLLVWVGLISYPLYLWVSATFVL